MNTATRNTCRMTLTRVGLYGDVTVHWAAGYTNNKLPEFAKQGQTVPPSGVVSLTEGESRLNFSLTVRNCSVILLRDLTLLFISSFNALIL